MNDEPPVRASHEQERPETPRESEQGAAGRAQDEADEMNRTDAEEVSAEDV
jgi:hypothetical protein